MEIHPAELARIKKMWVIEAEAYNVGHILVAGVDEVGRGPLAGPVVAACVILPMGVIISGINDSKKLSPKKRDELSRIIKEQALCFGLGVVDEETIDAINILNATHSAMKAAVYGLETAPGFVLVDGYSIPDFDIPQRGVIHGDALSVSIAAASIIAKVYRDNLMIEYDAKYPEYGFASHKGYGTARHIKALKAYGPCPIHRRTFIKNLVC